MKCCKGFIFLLVFCLLLGSASAYQKKLVVKECSLSFNEVPDANGNIPFAAWNNVANSGVFMKATNTNLEIGDDENSQWHYDYFQDNGEARKYFNNFEGVSDKENILPILNVKEGHQMMSI